MAGAFQSSAFQNDAFQIDGATPRQVEQRSVPRPRHREPQDFPWLGQDPPTREELRAERDRIKAEIDPSAQAQKVVEKIAAKAVEKAKKFDGAGVMQWLAKHQAEEAKRLERDLKRANVAYEQAYAQYLLFEVMLRIEIQIREAERAEKQRLQDEEDEQIAMLLMEL